MAGNNTPIMHPAAILQDWAIMKETEIQIPNVTVSYDEVSIIASSVTTASLVVHSSMFEPPDMDSVDVVLTNIVNILRYYYTPSIIVFGLSGGIVSTLALLNSMAASLPAACYLAACTSVDCLYLLSLLVRWLEELGYPVYTVGAICHAITFIDKASTFLSVWYMVSYSVNMLIVTKYPNAERQLSTVFKAKIVCLVLAVVATVVFLNTSLLVHVIVLPARQICTPSLEGSLEGINRRLKQLDVFVNFALPIFTTTCIAVSCAVQCYKDRECKRRGPHRPPQRSIHVRCDIEAGLRTLYFAYIITNTILILPHSLMNVVLTISTMTPYPMTRTIKRHLILELTRSLYNAKFAANFLVFLLSWRGFRAMLVVICTRTWRRLRRRDEQEGDVVFQEVVYIDYNIDGSSQTLYKGRDGEDNKKGNYYGV